MVSLNNINGLYAVNQGKFNTVSFNGLRHLNKDNFELSKAQNSDYSKTLHPISNPLTSQCAPKLLLKSYNNSTFIRNLMKKNPNIQNILKEVGVETPKVCTHNLNEIIDTHITTTTHYALMIANELGLSQADKKALEQASVFHDFGKVLMPQSIIDKPGRLEPNERKIIDTHAEVGAELLEAAGMNKRITNIIRNHHTPKNQDILCNILSVADIYSALREERSYKKPMSKELAFSILDQKAKDGEVSAEVVDALRNSLSRSIV